MILYKSGEQIINLWYLITKIKLSLIKSGIDCQLYFNYENDDQANIKLYTPI